MRSNSNPAPISFALKVVGSVLLAASLIDYIILLIQPNFTDPQWRFQFTTQLIDRGIVPLIGVGLIMLGLWMGSFGDRQASGGPLKPVALAISGILGLLFLLMAPLHIADAGKASATATRELNTQTTQVEAQLDARLQQERAQINQVLENPDQISQLDALLQQEGLSEADKTRLRSIKENLDRFKKDPTALEKQQETARNQALATINEQNQSKRNQIATEFNKSRLRVGFGGLMIAAAYLLICWTGFQGGR